MNAEEDFINGIAMMMCKDKFLRQKHNVFQKAKVIFDDLKANGDIYYCKDYEGLRLKPDVTGLPLQRGE
jgi:hypothetical protein